MIQGLVGVGVFTVLKETGSTNEYCLGDATVVSTLRMSRCASMTKSSSRLFLSPCKSLEPLSYGPALSAGRLNHLSELRSLHLCVIAYFSKWLSTTDLKMLTSATYNKRGMGTVMDREGRTACFLCNG